MDALTLILCRKVADIDGWSGVDTITNVGALAAVVDGKGGVMGKALLLDLMIKHEVWINWYTFCCELKGGNEVASRGFKNKRDLPRAILECIIQANDL
jgi:hypothetical protein